MLVPKEILLTKVAGDYDWCLHFTSFHFIRDADAMCNRLSSFHYAQLYTLNTHIQKLIN